MFGMLTALVIVLICSVRGDVSLTEDGEEPLRIISREKWGGEAPVEPLQELVLPVPTVIILHTSTESCYDFESCSYIVRMIQSFHVINRGWWDIGYNFLIGGDGNVYEGRGWERVGAHTYRWNAKSIGIAFIGAFDKTTPTPVQIEACKKLLEQGVSLEVLDKDYKLIGARQVSPTSSPGQKLYQEIKTWTHWSPSP